MSSQDKAEIDAYKLKDVAQVMYEKWRDERPFREGRITLGAFKTTFLDRLFPVELRQRKMQEFINLCRGCTSVKECSL